MEGSFETLYLLSRQSVDGRRERSGRRDTCRDSKHQKIMFGRGPDSVFAEALIADSDFVSDSDSDSDSDLLTSDR